MLRLTCIIVFIALISGCSVKHDYAWTEYPITPERVIIIDTNQSSAVEDSIEIKSGNSDTNKIILGHIHGNAHYWYGSLQTLTDSIVLQISKELIKRNYTLETGGDKTVLVRATNYRLEPGFWRYAYNIDVELTLGNGTIKNLKVRNSSPGTPVNGINGAVALAVIEILNMEEFIEYINQDRSFNIDSLQEN